MTRLSHLKIIILHLITLTGEKPHQCSKHGWNPYQCSQCDNDFTCNKILKDILRTHTGNKPYQCRHGDMAFTN